MPVVVKPKAHSFKLISNLFLGKRAFRNKYMFKLKALQVWLKLIYHSIFLRFRTLLYFWRETNFFVMFHLHFICFMTLFVCKINVYCPRAERYWLDNTTPTTQIKYYHHLNTIYRDLNLSFMVMGENYYFLIK